MAIEGELKDELTKILEERDQSIKAEMNQAISGAIKRLTAETATAMKEQFESIQGNIQTSILGSLDEKLSSIQPQGDIVKQTVDAILEELASSEGAKEPPANDEGDAEHIRQQILREVEAQQAQTTKLLEKKIAALETRAQQATEIAEQERARAEQERSAATEARRRNALKEAIATSGLFIPEAVEDVLDKALRQGHFIPAEEEDTYLFPTKDEYGIDTKVDPRTGVTKLADMREYMFFRPARPGVGVGATPAGQPPAPTKATKVLDEEAPNDISPEELLDAWANPERAKALLADLETLAS